MSTFKIRTRVFLSLLLVTPLGFVFKFYSGPWNWWFNDYGAGLLYEVFWILIVFFFIPMKKAIPKISVWVFLTTGSLEILQLWHPWFLETLRSYFIVGALIGTTFSWWDFPHYLVGCIVGSIWLKRLSKAKGMRVIMD